MHAGERFGVSRSCKVIYYLLLKGMTGFPMVSQTGWWGCRESVQNQTTKHPLQPPAQASFTAPPYDYIWTLGQGDVEGGIIQLLDVYFQQLLNSYQ